MIDSQSRTIQIGMCAHCCVPRLPRTYLACACICGLVDHTTIILRVTLGIADHFRLHLLVAGQDKFYGVKKC